MNYILKKYSNLRPAITAYIAKIVNSSSASIDEKCELLLTANELSLKGPNIEDILNEIANCSIDQLNLVTTLIRQFVLIKNNTNENERKQFINYWLHDEFYKEQDFVTASIIYWIAIEDFEFLSDDWKVKLPRKIENLEKSIKAIIIRAWLPYYLERFDKLELAKKVINEILLARDKNGSWSGNIEKTLKISFALSCSKFVDKDILRKTIEFLNSRIILGVNFNIKNCALILKVYYKLGLIEVDLLSYIQDNISNEQSKSSSDNSFSKAKTRVFVSYSHADAKWLNRVIVHLKPIETKGLLELWSDKKITPGKNWKDEIKNALDKSVVAILLVSADFLASDFINNHELPSLLNSATTKGTIIIPVLINHSLFSDSILSKFQAINSPEKPLVGLKKNEQEKALKDLATIINKYLTS